MRNVGRKTLVAVGIAVALAVGPGVGMANAQPPLLPPIPDLSTLIPTLPAPQIQGVNILYT
jgi:hypothetical protein